MSLNPFEYFREKIADGKYALRTQQSGSDVAYDEDNDLQKVSEYRKENVDPLKLSFDDIVWTWFTRPNLVTYNGQTYFSGVDSKGNTIIGQYDNDTKEIKRNILDNISIDDHQPAAIRVMYNNSKKVLVMWGGHSNFSEIRYKWSDNPEDISSFGEMQTLSATGDTTYAQLWSTNDEPYTYCITRSRGVGWEIFYSDDAGLTWSNAVQLTDGVSYIITGKKRLTTNEVNIVLSSSGRNTPGKMSFGKLDVATGDINLPNGTNVANVISGEGLPLGYDDLHVFYDETDNACWAWDTQQNRIAYAVYPNQDYTVGEYHVATYDSDSDTFNTVKIDDAGGTLSEAYEPAYSGGIAFAGNSVARTFYYSKEVNGSFEMFRAYTTDTSTLEDWAIEQLTFNSNIKHARPIKNFHGGSNSRSLPVLWFSGKYLHYTRYYTKLDHMLKNFKV